MQLHPNAHGTTLQSIGMQQANRLQTKVLALLYCAVSGSDNDAGSGMLHARYAAACVRYRGPLVVLLLPASTQQLHPDAGRMLAPLVPGRGCFKQRGYHQSSRCLHSQAGKGCNPRQSHCCGHASQTGGLCG